MHDLVTIRFAESRIGREDDARCGIRSAADAIGAECKIEPHYAKCLLQVRRLVVRDGRDFTDAETTRRLLRPLRSLHPTRAIEGERRVHDVFDRPDSLAMPARGLDAGGVHENPTA